MSLTLVVVVLHFHLIPDFVLQKELGKPAATDLKLGLATAPVLFACEKFPELNVMIMRRFSEQGDVERAYDFVMKVKSCESFEPNVNVM
jgi:decaprenyl-diphosphate synthase subunit 1